MDSEEGWFGDDSVGVIRSSAVSHCCCIVAADRPPTVRFIFRRTDVSMPIDVDQKHRPPPRGRKGPVPRERLGESFYICHPHIVYPGIPLSFRYLVNLFRSFVIFRSVTADAVGICLSWWSATQLRSGLSRDRFLSCVCHSNTRFARVWICARVETRLPRST